MDFRFISSFSKENEEERKNEKIESGRLCGL